MKLRLIAIFLLGFLLGAAGLLRHTQQLLQPAAQGARPVLFQVRPGASLARVALELEHRGLVRSALAAEWVARFDGLESRLQAGEYELSPDRSTREILALIASGRVKTWPVTIPEGSRAVEIAAKLERAGLVDATEFMTAVDDRTFARDLGIDGDSLEGYLYPDTYHLPRGRSAHAVARTMVTQFQRVWRERIEPLLSRSSPTLAQGLSKHEIVTLASIVEKETAAAQERPLIAAVFLNRLRRGMRLETDPTVIYGIENFDGNLRKRDLLDPTNSYNTYRIGGLPPGPIASPGIESLRAVVEPARVDYLYFVSRNDGRHHFSSSYAEHVNAVNRYQRRRHRR